MSNRLHKKRTLIILKFIQPKRKLSIFAAVLKIIKQMNDH